MRESSNPIVSLPAASSHDVLTSVLRNGAVQLLAQAIDAEVAEWIDLHQHVKDQEGQPLCVTTGGL